MSPDEIHSWLTRSFEDRRLSRTERQALVAIAGATSSLADREAIRQQAFEVARVGSTDPTVLDWLEDVLKATREPVEAAGPADLAEAFFSPGDECLRAITRLLDRARKTVDICVFTITDDRLSTAILGAHRRSVAIRIITDNTKAEDLGSDVGRFEQAGITVRVDRSPFHMHHKFAIFDASTLLTGSYNWTRGAAADNEENLITTSEPRLVGPFGQTFDRLWANLA